MLSGIASGETIQVITHKTGFVAGKCKYHQNTLQKLVIWLTQQLSDPPTATIQAYTLIFIIWLHFLLFACGWRLVVSWLLFANSLDPDQARQKVGPELDPSCLTTILFLKEFFKEVDFEKILVNNKKLSEIYPACNELENTGIVNWKQTSIYRYN